MKTGKVAGLCVGKDKGIAKTSVDAIRLIENHGVEGDAHAGTENQHVSLIGIEIYKSFIDRGIKVNSGDFAENITTEGINLIELPVGSRIRIGNIELEVTQIGKPNPTGYTLSPEIGEPPLMSKGIFAAVVVGGEINVGDKIETL
ncbi:MOSC domain-containing protein [bacterium]|nr:MOSC domain-containing protein [bacterium]